MNEENMRRIVIFGKGEFDVLGSLKNLDNWSLQRNQFEGHPYYLQNGETKIYLRIIANNVISTSNVLPQDHMERHPSFKDEVLQSLVADLNEKNIENILEISENDEKLLRGAANSCFTV